MEDALDTRQPTGLPSFGYPPELPICAHREEILSALRRSAVVVVCGDTGSSYATAKTTDIETAARIVIFIFLILLL